MAKVCHLVAWFATPQCRGDPDRVKALLLAHCTDLARDPYIQGKGMPNLVKMMMNT
jgi:hypothetical protein